MAGEDLVDDQIREAAVNEEHAQFLLNCDDREAYGESPSELTLEIAKSLTPEDLCTLFAVHRDYFPASTLAHLLHLVSEEVESRLAPACRAF